MVSLTLDPMQDPMLDPATDPASQDCFEKTGETHAVRIDSLICRLSLSLCLASSYVDQLLRQHNRAKRLEKRRRRETE